MTEVALRDYVHEIDGMIENSAYDAAINHSRHILQHFPKYVEVYRVLGKALLEKGDDAAAADVFQRVLSVDPEDFVARVGLSIIHDRAGQLDSAIWHMERAFDLMPSNEIIQSELRRLYARRDGVEPERVSLTRDALARMYAHGDLYAEAIANLRQLLQDQPDRLDLKILLTEVLWRDDQRVDAADLAQYILAELPYCLKANLIYGKLLHDSGSSDSDVPLRRAQAADPDNVQAVRLFGSESPLTPQQTMLARLEQPSYEALLEGEGGAAEPEEVPDWLRGLAELNTPTGMLEAPESATNPPLATGLHMPGTEQQRGEIPEWLQGLSVPQPEPAEPAAEIPSWLTQLGAASVSPTPEPTTAVTADDWLNQLQTSTPAEPAAVKSDDEVPDWIRQLGTGELKAADLPVVEPTAEETPDWLSQLGGFNQPEQPSVTVTSSAQTEEPADWLSELSVAAPTETATPSEPDEMPDWLRQIRASDSEATTEEPGTPDWLSSLRDNTPPIAEPTAPSETPDWLAQLQATASDLEEVPPFEDHQPEPEPEVAPRFGVDADRDTVNRLIAAFESDTAEPSETQAEPGIEAEEPLVEVEEPVAEVASEPEPTSVAPAAELPQEMPSADDALAFLARLAAGKEDQLRAEAEQEGESRMAAIMGRKPVEPEKPIEPEPEPTESKSPSLSDVVTPVAEAGAGLIGLAGMAVAGVAHVVRGEAGEQPVAEAEPVAEAASAVESAPAVELPQEMPSADDALAFLSRLAAGKEDQLRAEAEQEGESRMAAIMGRKPVEPEKPIEPEPVLTPEPEPEPTPVVPTAEVSDEMPSADDALAFLARLAAGKEDQLRAEAEQEGESRMAAIMGRKPTQPLKPAESEPAPVPEPEPELTLVAPTAEVSDEMPSADDALAFLARLAAGKEDQLRAEAEQEGESRMAAIMGRKPVEPVKPIEPEPEPVEVEPAAVEPVADWISQLAAAPTFDAAQPTSEGEMPDWLRALQPTTDEESGVTAAFEIAEPTPETDMPDWLRAMQPTDETAIASEREAEAPAAETSVEPIEPATVGEQPDWLHDLHAVETPAAPTPSDELPDWLRAMQPDTIEVVAEAEPLPEATVETVETVGAEPIAEVPVAETPAVEEPTAEATPVEIMPAEVETPAPAAIVEPEPLVAVVEPEPIETPTPAVAEVAAVAAQIEDQSTLVGSMDWWTQVAEDEGEAPLAELPPVVKVAAVASAVAARAPREREPLRRPERLERPMRDLRPRETRTREARETHPTPPPLPTVSSVDVDPLVAQLESDKYNHTVRLELARAWWAMGNRDSALIEYAKLVNPATVEDLSPEELAEREEFDFVDAGPLADDIIADLERIVEVDEQPVSLRLLGDMHMKVGNLSRALEMYRRALNQL